MAGLIVHEWIESQGGSELVLDQLASIFPDAKIYCLWNDAPDRFASGRVQESWIARTPLRKNKAIALLFMPITWRHVKVGYKPDWVLTSSHLFAHHIKIKDAPTIPKFVYVHSPARYIWSPDLDPRGSSFLAKLIAVPLRLLDRIRTKEASSIAANSKTVKNRILDYWGRNSIVINPPVDVGFFSESRVSLSKHDQSVLDSLPCDFFLGASRFVSYKRLEQAIRFGMATKTDVVLAGSGPDEHKLREFAEAFPGRVHFVIAPSRELLREIMKKSKALVFAANEDFGIIPVEAMATGTPVIGLNKGGVSETVVDGVSGFLLDNFDNESSSRANDGLRTINSELVMKRAGYYSPEIFREKILEWVTGSN